MTVAATGRLFWRNEGDAAVYWVFADSMWTDGFFHFGRATTSHGATSPAWAFLLSLASAPGIVDPVVAWKLLSLLAWVSLAAVTYRLGRAATASKPVAYGATILVLLHPPMRLFATSTYETPFFAALVALAVLRTITLPINEPSAREAWPWLASLTALLLGRPEGALVWTTMVGLALVRYRSWRVVALLAVTLVPAALFFLWMYAETGLLIPSSITARQIMSEIGDTYLRPVPVARILARSFGVIFQGAPTTWGLASAVQALLLGAGVVVLLARRPAMAAAFLCLGALFALGLVMNNPGYYLDRYASPLVPLAAVVLCAGAHAWYHWLARPPGRWLVLVACAIVLLQPVQTAIATTIGPPPRVVDVLDRTGGQTLNHLLTDADVVLTYEVQTEYVLRARVMSADGIVGGEILPYLRRGDIASFLRDYHVTYILASQAFTYRGLFNGTLLESLERQDHDVAIGQRIRIEGVWLRKIATYDREDDSAFWHSAYLVEPSGSYLPLGP